MTTDRRLPSRKVVALLAASAAFLVISPISLAQTWIAPTSGVWNHGGNWAGGTIPVSAVNTQLTFPSSGASGYAAFNDLGAPFTLNAMNFDNSGSGTISLAGAPLLLDGAARAINVIGNGPVAVTNALLLSSGGGQDTTLIGGMGAGTLVLSGSLSSTVSPTASTGAILNVDNPNTTVVLSGGANLHALRTNRGNLVLNGGVYNLTSTLRENDQFGDNNGFWSLDVNSQANGHASFAMNGGTLNAAQGFFSVGTSSVTNVSFTNGAYADFSYGTTDTTRGRFGFLYGGTLNVSGGSVVRCRLFDGERNFWGGTPVAINVDGAGSRIDVSEFLSLPRGDASVAMSITNGGVVSVNGDAFNAYTPDYLGDPIPNYTTVVVCGAGSRYDVTGRQIWGAGGGQGTLIIGPGGTVSGGSYQGGGPGFSGLATLLIRGGTFTSRGQFNLKEGFVQITSGTLELTGTGSGTLLNAFINEGSLIVSGPNSRYIQTGSSTLTTIGQLGNIVVGDGALMQTGSAGLTMGGFGVSVTVSGPGSRLLVGSSGSGSGNLVVVTGGANVIDGAIIQCAGAAVVDSNGSLSVGSGNTPATLRTSGGLTVSGIAKYNAGTLIAGDTLSVSGQVLLSPAGADRSNIKTPEIGAVSLSAAGVIDLNDNDMLIHSDQMSYVTQQIRDARHGGLWNSPGITSTAARDQAAHSTTLGVLSGAEFNSVNGGTTQFDGRDFAPSDTLVKYTYYGDTDFNGVVDFDDYARVDAGFNNNRTGWLNGDVDGNGIVDFDDYSLIDLAFNTQSGTLRRAIDYLDGSDRSEQGMNAASLKYVVTYFAQFDERYATSFLKSLPEPTTASAGAALFALASASGRRCRRGSRRREVPLRHERVRCACNPTGAF